MPRVHVLRTDLYDNVPNGSYAPSLVTGEKQYLSVTLRINLFISLEINSFKIKTKPLTLSFNLRLKE